MERGWPACPSQRAAAPEGSWPSPARATSSPRHPDRCALVIALEFASLTFQRWTAPRPTWSPPRSSVTAGRRWVLADAIPARPRRRCRPPRRRRERLLRRHDAPHGLPPPQPGLQIVLDRELAPFVRREVAAAVKSFLEPRGLQRDDVTRWVLHPGGRRIIE